MLDTDLDELFRWHPRLELDSSTSSSFPSAVARRKKATVRSTERSGRGEAEDESERDYLESDSAQADSATDSNGS